MSTLKLISLLAMAFLYTFAGVSHFRKPKFFIAITPQWVPYPEKVNLLVGAIEIVLGLLLLLTGARVAAAWGIIILLVAVFPANVYHFQKALKKKKGVLLTLIRLPIQAILIYWAYSFI